MLNILERSTITASSEGIAEPVSNLLIPQPTKYWRAVNPFSSSHTLNFNYSSSTVSCLALFSLELPSDATINIKLYNGITLVKEFNFTGEQVVYGYGEGPYGLFAYGGYAAPGREWMQKFRVFWFEDIISDNMLVTISNTTEVSLGYIHLGPSWGAPFGINKDYISTFNPISKEMSKTVGGVSVGSLARNYREIEITLIMLSGEEMTSLMENFDNYKPIVFSAFAEENSSNSQYGTLLCKIPTGITVVGAPHKRFNANLVLEEIK